MLAVVLEYEHFEENGEYRPCFTYFYLKEAEMLAINGPLCKKDPGKSIPAAVTI